MILSGITNDVESKNQLNPQSPITFTLSGICVVEHIATKVAVVVSIIALQLLRES